MSTISHVELDAAALAMATTPPGMAKAGAQAESELSITSAWHTTQ